MKKLENKIMLITYSDSMGHNLKELEEILSTYFKDAVGGVHILPFFPSSGLCTHGLYEGGSGLRGLAGRGAAGGRILSDV